MAVALNGPGFRALAEECAARATKAGTDQERNALMVRAAACRRVATARDRARAERLPNRNPRGLQVSSRPSPSQTETQVDLTRISLSTKTSVAFWTIALGIDKRQLAQLVQRFGNSAAVIRRELRR
jgi:hypothetical protein